MSNRKPRELFAETVCAHAGSVIAVALCLAGLVPVFLLGAAFVSEARFLEGLTTLAIVAGLLLFHRWPGHGVLVDSIMNVILLIAAGVRRISLSAIAPVRMVSLRP